MNQFNLTNKEKELLAIIERKPYRKYTQLSLTPRAQSLSESSDNADAVINALQRLSKLGLIRQETFYFSANATKTKL